MSRFKSSTTGFLLIIFLIFSIFITFVDQNEAGAAAIEMKKGGTTEAPVIEYFDNNFIIKGKSIHRDNVKKVVFANEENTKRQSEKAAQTSTAGAPASSEDKNTIEIPAQTGTVNDEGFTRGVAINEKSGPALIDGKSDYKKFVRKNTFPESDINEYRKHVKELQKKYPDAEEYILKDWGINTLRPDGTRFYRYTAAIKILKDSALSTSKITIGLTEDREKVYFNMARNILPNGKIIYAKADDIEVSEAGSGGASISRYKIVTVNIPEVKVGSIVEYSYTSDNFNPFKKDIFFPSFAFTDYNPVKHSRFEVIAPKGTKFAWAGKNMGKGVDPVITRGTPNDKWVWEFFDVKPIIPEPMMPSYRDVAKSLKVSSYEKDWKRFFKFRRSLVQDKIKPTAYVKNLAEKITKGCKTDREKSAALYHWIQENIRYISVKSGISSGLGGHFAEETLKNGFGDCIDKAIVMSAMHQSVGIEAYPVALKTNSSNEMERRIPCFDTNHAIAIVYPDGKPMILDATSSNYRYPYFREDDHGVYCINYFKNELYFIELPAPEANASITTRDYKVDSSGSVIVKQVNKYTGSREAGLRGYVKSLREDRRKRALQQMVAGFLPGGVLQDYKFYNVNEISKPFWFECAYKGENFLAKAGKYWILDLKQETTYSEVNLAERKYDLEYTSSGLREKVYTIQLPEGIEPSFMPEKVDLKTKWADFSGEYKMSGPSTLVFKTRFTRKKRMVSKDDYKPYKKFLKRIERFYEEKVFLKKAGQRTDNLLVLKDGTEDRGTVVSISKEKVVFRDKNEKEKNYAVKDLSRIEVYKTYRQDGVTRVDQIPDEEIRSLIENEPMAKDYPNTGKVTMLYNREWNIKRDGTWTQKTHVLEKVLMERGKSAGTFYGSYIPGQSDYSVSFARSINNGKIQYLTGYSVKESDRYGSYPEYNKVKSVKSVIPSVNVNTIIEYLTEKKIIKPDIIDNSLYYMNIFSASEPCLTDRTVFVYPREMELDIVRKNWTDDIIEKKEMLPENMVRHIFERKNIKPTVQEANRPPAMDYQPTLIISSKKDYSRISSEFFKRLSKVKSPEKDSQFTRKIKSIVKGLDISRPEHKEKAIAGIYQYVAKNIQLLRCTPAYTGYTPRPADEIFLQSRGNNLDKTWLFAQALELVGIKSKMVMLHNRYMGLFEPSLADLAQFSTFAVKLEDKRLIYVNSKYNLIYTVPVEYTGSQSLVVGEGEKGLVFIPKADLKSELILQKVNAELMVNGDLKVSSRCFYNGTKGQGNRQYFYLKKEELDKKMERRAASIHSRAKIKTYSFKNLEELNKKIETSFEYNIKSYPKRAGDKVLAFQVPDFYYSATEFGRDTREYPLFLGGVTNTETHFRLKLPKGYKVSYMCDSFSISLDGVSLQYELSQDDGYITVIEKYNRWKQAFSKDFYFDFKKLAEKRALSREEWIVLEKE